MNDSRKCKTCGSEKPLAEFPLRAPDYKGRVYRRFHCMSCFAEIRKEWHRKDAQRVKELRAQHPMPKREVVSKEEKAAKSAEYQRKYQTELRRLAEIGRKYEAMMKAQA